MNFKMLIFLMALVPTMLFAIEGTERGGGNFSGDDLAEVAQNSGTSILSKAELLQYLRYNTKALAVSLPAFERELEDIILIKNWLVDPKKIDTEKCAFGSSVVLEYQSVACHYDMEIRINQAFWTGATEAQRADLVLHEAVMGLQLRRNLPNARTSHLVWAIKTNSELGAENFNRIRYEILNGGFGFYLLNAEREVMIQRFSQKLGPICQSTELDWKFRNELKKVTLGRSPFGPMNNYFPETTGLDPLEEERVLGWIRSSEVVLSMATRTRDQSCQGLAALFDTVFSEGLRTVAF